MCRAWMVEHVTQQFSFIFFPLLFVLTVSDCTAAKIIQSMFILKADYVKNQHRFIPLLYLFSFPLWSDQCGYLLWLFALALFVFLLSEGSLTCAGHVLMHV